MITKTGCGITFPDSDERPFIKNEIVGTTKFGGAKHDIVPRELDPEFRRLAWSIPSKSRTIPIGPDHMLTYVPERYTQTYTRTDGLDPPRTRNVSFEWVEVIFERVQVIF